MKIMDCHNIGHYSYHVGQCQYWNLDYWLKTGIKQYPMCLGRLDCPECDEAEISKWDVLNHHWSG